MRPETQKAFDEYAKELFKDAESVRMYNVRSEGYVDVRSIFKTTAKEDEEMRIYFTELLQKHPELEGLDDKALFLAKHISGKVKYISDRDNFGVPEYWSGPYSVFKSWSDDCEDYSFLIVKAWEIAGIPATRRFIWVGDIFSIYGKFAGGHGMPIYWKMSDNTWYAVEGSYYRRRSYKEYGIIPLKDVKRYGKTWFLFNEKVSYKGTRYVK